MLLSQILFIISAMFLPVSLLISMIPAFSGTSRRAVISLFNTIMLRVGTTLLTTFVLVLSSLAYTIANGKPFVVVVLLQVIVFAGVYMERDKLLGMIGLRDEGTGRVGRAMTNRPRPDDLSCCEKGTAICGGCWSRKALCTAPCRAEHQEDFGAFGESRKFKP